MAINATISPIQKPSNLKPHFLNLIAKEFVVDKESLPEGSTIQSYFDLTIDNDEKISIKFNKGATCAQQKMLMN